MVMVTIATKGSTILCVLSHTHRMWHNTIFWNTTTNIHYRKCKNTILAVCAINRILVL